MKLFRFVIASLLALVLVLSPALSYANSATATLPAGFQMPSVGDVAKRIVSRSNVVNYAVVGLLGAVDWVLDPKNNQVIYNIPTGNYCSVNQSKDCVNTLEEAEKKFIRFYNNYARREVLRDSDVECQFEFRGSTTSIICNWGFPDEKLKFRQFTYHGKVVPNRISNEQVAEQIVKNAKAGHAESVDFVLLVDNEIALLSSQRGKNNVADTGIEKDYYAETNNGKTQDRCEWLKANKHRYSAQSVKDTEKAWKCRHSRQSKDSKS